MRILLISRCPPWPLYLGDRLIVYHLAEEMEARKHELDFLAFADRPDDWHEQDHYDHLFNQVRLFKDPTRSQQSYLKRLLLPASRFPTRAEQSWSPEMWQAIEAQLANGEAGDIWFQYDAQKQLPKLNIDPTRKNEVNKEGRQYFRIGKGEKIEKPIGEWNDYEITCKGGDVTISVNGRLVNEGKDGSLTQGRIGLQAEGAEIHFKDIELKPLK